MHESNRESFSFPAPGQHRPPEADDPLTAILRQGAQRLLVQAVEAEVEQWIADHAYAFHELRPRVGGSCLYAVDMKQRLPEETPPRCRRVQLAGLSATQLASGVSIAAFCRERG